MFVYLTDMHDLLCVQIKEVIRSNSRRKCNLNTVVKRFSKNEREGVEIERMKERKKERKIDR